MTNTSPKRKRLSTAQKTALNDYRNALAAEERFLGSAFVSPHGQAIREQATAVRYQACKALGMSSEHGL